MFNAGGGFVLSHQVATFIEIRKVTAVNGLTLTVVRQQADTLPIPALATSEAAANNRRGVIPVNDRTTILPPDFDTFTFAISMAASPYGIYVPHAMLIRSSQTHLLWQIRTQEAEIVYLTSLVGGTTRILASTAAGLQRSRALPVIPVEPGNLFDAVTRSRFVDASTLDYNSTPIVERSAAIRALLPLASLPAAVTPVSVVSIDWQGYAIAP